MAGGEAEAVGHQLARRVGVLHVGEDHDHRPPAHAQGQVRQRMPEVGLDVRSFDRVQRLGQEMKLCGSPLRLDEAGDAIVEGHEPDPVAMGLRDPGQHQRGIDCMVQLVELSCRRGHQPAAVDGDHHLLAALSFDLDHHRPVRAGRGAASAGCA